MRCRLALLCLLLTGCGPSVTVQTDYLSRKNLASYKVGTPDPHINHPNIGERLIIQWSLPKKVVKYRDAHLQVTLRFRNYDECTYSIPLKKKYGTTTYDLTNTPYYESGGIQTYKIDVVANGCILKEWKHQLWVDLIKIGEPDDSPNKNLHDEKCEDECKEGC